MLMLISWNLLCSLNLKLNSSELFSYSFFALFTVSFVSLHIFLIAFLSERRNGPSSARTAEQERVDVALVSDIIPPKRALAIFLVEGLFDPARMSPVRIHWRIFLMAVLSVLVVVRLLFFG